MGKYLLMFSADNSKSHFQQIVSPRWSVGGDLSRWRHESHWPGCFRWPFEELVMLEGSVVLVCKGGSS